ncbi:response regulator [Nitrospira sp. Kam-Ns4a]
MTTEPGRGTTFKVGLPRVEAPLTPPEDVSGAMGARRGSGTVLLVEDDEMIRTLASHALHEHGYAVLEAATGEEAVRLCRERRDSLHLVITDVVLPGISGYELAQRLKGLQADIKVVYISGYPGHTLDRYGPVDSSSPLLQKPFSLDRLVQTVHEMLAS